MNDNRISALDRMRISAGAGRLRQNFKALAATDRREALRLLSDEKLQFPSLFILLPVISDYKLTDAMGLRNIAAAAVCAKKLGRFEPFAGQAEVWENEGLYQALVWMFTTGWEWDAPGADRDDYEAVIDYVTAVLVIIFEDESILPDAASLIYRRHRRGRLIHDLVWCFFQTLDADVLGRVAENLLSPDSRDIALTCKMLDLETAPPPNRYEAKNLYDDYIAWLKENKPYLYVTGEHFQQMSMPKHFGVDREAKYLGRALSPRYRTPLEPLTEHEVTCLHEYRGFSDEEQELLTDYSHRLRSTDAGAWDAWMNKQVAEQVIAAKGGYEAI